jgi:preprotein translocase subunit SecE
MNRYIYLSFIGMGLLVWLIVAKGLGTLWQMLKWNDFRILGENLTLTGLVGFGFAAVFVLFLWKHERVNKLAEEIAQELKKVTWPTRAELKAATIVVIITVIVMSAILGLFDAFWSMVTSKIY